MISRILSFSIVAFFACTAALASDCTDFSGKYANVEEAVAYGLEIKQVACESMEMIHSVTDRESGSTMTMTMNIRLDGVYRSPDQYIVGLPEEFAEGQLMAFSVQGDKLVAVSIETSKRGEGTLVMKSSTSTTRLDPAGNLVTEIVDRNAKGDVTEVNQDVMNRTN